MVQAADQATMTLRIDGREVTAPRGATILEAANANGIYIPTLCYDDRIKAYGACRMCLVVQDGRPGMPASCVTPAAPDASYRTNTDEVLEIRRSVLNLLMSEHPHGCLTCDRIVHCGPNDICLRNVSVTDRCVVCPQNQRCELQAAVEITGVTETLLPYTYRDLPVRTEDPYIDRDYNLCIACARCVRVCDEVIGAEAISMVDRGDRILPGTPNDVPLSDPLSGCIFCGACVDACPVGALTEKENKWAGLPDRTVKTVCTECEVGCQLSVELKDGKFLRVTPDLDGGANAGLACVRGKFQLTDAARREDRLLAAWVRAPGGGLAEVPFDAAVQAAAEGLRSRRAGAFALVASTAASNEDAYVLARFAREAMGSEHVAVTASAPSTARSEVAEVFGLGASTNPLADIAGSKAIILTGGDIEVTHPVAAFQVHRAVNYEDARLVGIGPEEYTELGRAASAWLRCRPGSEPRVLEALMAVAVQDGLLPDRENEEERTDGLGELVASLEAVDIQGAAEAAGLDEQALRQAARLIAETDGPAAFVHAPQEGGADGTARNLARFAFLTGNVGRELGGLHLLPLGGGNAQGTADAGLAPETAGNGLAGVIEAIDAGDVRAVYWHGGLPDPAVVPSDRLRNALARLEFLVYQSAAPDELLMEHADVVIPQAVATEYDATYTNAERRVQRARPVMPPQQDAPPAWSVASSVARALGSEGFGYGDAEAVFAEAAERLPRYDGLSYAALDDGLTGPVWPLGGDGILHRDRFAHPDGKARLAPLAPTGGA